MLFSFAGQLVVAARSAYVPFRLSAEENADPAGLCDAIRASGGLLSAVIRAVPPDQCGCHPGGLADGEGLAAMGMTELFLHGNDIALGLGLDFSPPQELCGVVVARLFPAAPAHDDQWDLLRWLTGRVDLPGHERGAADWSWHAAPLHQ